VSQKFKQCNINKIAQEHFLDSKEEQNWSK